MARLIILGAGGHAHSIADMVLQQNEHVLAGFLDDAYPGILSIWGVPVLGKLAGVADFRSLADSLWQLAAMLFGRVCLRT